MKNIFIYINCALIDFKDVQIQINTIINNILFELSGNNYHPTYSVNYNNSGLVVSITNVNDFFEPYFVIVKILSEYGWLDSLVKIEFVDLLSDLTVCMVPTSSLPESIISDNDQPLSNCVNFN
ncbi:MAG: hypothetical protein WAR79_17495 [Melioribacteraceae bacterium]